MIGLKTLIASALLSMAAITAASARLPESATQTCSLGRACGSAPRARSAEPLGHIDLRVPDPTVRNFSQPTICLANPPFFCEVNGE